MQTGERLGQYEVLHRLGKGGMGDADLSGMPYDISPIDGRFLMTKPIPSSLTGPTHVSVVLNWLTGLRDREAR